MKKLTLLLSVFCIYSCSASHKETKSEDADISTELLTGQTSDNKQSAKILSGILTIGHEVRSFKPEGSDDEFWIVDKTGKLSDEYDKVTGGIKNGKPTSATLKLEYQGKWDDGFAAEYCGVYFVKEVIHIETVR